MDLLSAIKREERKLEKELAKLQGKLSGVRAAANCNPSQGPRRRPPGQPGCLPRVHHAAAGLGWLRPVGARALPEVGLAGSPGRPRAEARWPECLSRARFSGSPRRLLEGALRVLLRGTTCGVRGPFTWGPRPDVSLAAEGGAVRKPAAPTLVPG